MKYSAYGEYGSHEFDELRVVPEVKVYEYTYEDLTGGSSDEFNIPIPADTLVLNVGHEVVTSLSSGTSLIIGDADTSNGWAQTGSTTLGTVGNFFQSLGTAVTFAQGKKYNSTGLIKLKFTAPPSGGSGRVYVWMIPSVAATWRLPKMGTLEHDPRSEV